MSAGTQFSSWAAKVAEEAKANQQAPALFWASLKQCLQEAVNSLNDAFGGEAVELIYGSEFSVRAKYNNRVLIMAVDLTTARVEYHIDVMGSNRTLMEEASRGYMKLRLQHGTADLVKAEDASFEGFAWLSSQSLRRWPLSARIAQYLLQKLVAPELSELEFVRP